MNAVSTFPNILLGYSLLIFCLDMKQMWFELSLNIYRCFGDCLCSEWEKAASNYIANPVRNVPSTSPYCSFIVVWRAYVVNGLKSLCCDTNCPRLHCPRLPWTIKCNPVSLYLGFLGQSPSSGRGAFKLIRSLND